MRIGRTPAAFLLAALGLVSLVWLVLRLPPSVDHAQGTAPHEQEPAPHRPDSQSLALAESGRSLLDDPPASMTPEPRGETASLVVRAQWHDGRPARETGVLVVPADSTRPLHEMTDVDGIAVFERLTNGRKAVRGDRGGSVPVWIDAGEHRVDLVIPEGLIVHVHVIDESGANVPGAQVSLSSGQHSRDAWAVGLTDFAGRFILEHAEKGRSLCVRAKGYEPSPSVVIAEDALEEGGIIEVRLRCGGSRLVGRVIDGDTGTAVVGAEVRVRGGSREMPMGNQEARLRIHHPPAPAVARTDEDGRFLLEGLHSGSLVTTIAHPGYLSWKGISELPHGGTSDIQAELMPFAPLRGQVIDRGGDGIGAVLVSIGDPAAFDFIYSMSDPGGRFEFRVLREGLQKVVAQAPGGLWQMVEVRIPHHGGPLLIEMGPPREPTGWATTQDGDPLAGWFITHSEEKAGPGPTPRSRPVARTDERGRFWLSPPEDRPGWLHFWPPVSSAPFPVGIVRYDPGGTVRFECDEGARGGAQITVEIELTGDGSWASRPAVRLVQDATGFLVTRIVDRGGRIAFPGLPSGEYRVHFLFASNEVRDGGTVFLQPGEPHGLGVMSEDDLHRLPRVY